MIFKIKKTLNIKRFYILLNYHLYILYINYKIDLFWDIIQIDFMARSES